MGDRRTIPRRDHCRGVLDYQGLPRSVRDGTISPELVPQSPLSQRYSVSLQVGFKHASKPLSVLPSMRGLRFPMPL